MLEQSDSPPPPTAAAAEPALAPASARIHCIRCGYDLTGVALGATCPECGVRVDHALIPGGASSGYAIASMVLGIVALVMCPGSWGILSAVCGPLAILFWHRAQRQIRESRVSPASKGMATAGLVMGIIGTVLGVIGVGGFGWMILWPIIMHW